MRILHLNPFYFPYAGGIERRIREVARRHGNQHEVHVVTARLEGTEPETHEAGLHAHRLRSRFSLRGFYNPPLVKTYGLDDAIAEIHPDVIDLHFRWSPSYLRAFGRAKAARVFTYHNTFGEGSGALGFLSRFNDQWTRPPIARSHRVVCISDFIRRDLARNAFPADRLAVVPNGVDPEALRTEAAGPPNAAPSRLVGVGRLVRLKGFDLILRALRLLPRDIELVICGEGPQHAALRRLAERIGVGDRVQLPGWVEEPEKLALVRDSLLFVHVPRFEAFGLAALEALALGTPVVASRVGGLLEVVGEAGIPVPPENPRAIANAVLDYRHSPTLQQRLKAAAPVQAARYTWDRTAQDLLGTYEAAIGFANL